MVDITKNFVTECLLKVQTFLNQYAEKCSALKWYIDGWIKLQKIAIRGDGKSPDQKVIDMQLQAANLVYIFDVIILSVTANKSGRLAVETSFLPLNSSKGGTLKCKP